jgi:ATP-dependent Zn protease
MNSANVDWLRVLLNWFPMLLLIGVWMLFLRKGGIYANQKRAADALERIANALEKRQ